MPGVIKPGRAGSSVFAGGLILAIGVLFLLNNLGLVDIGGIMQWWPLILIAVGVWLFISNGFGKPVAPLILIGIGVFFLIDSLGFSFNIFDYWRAVLCINSNK